nr:hypothetical protein [Tanacetum cinerariifolium]
MDKIRRENRKEVHARLDFGENPRKSRRVREGSQNSSAGTLPARAHSTDSAIPTRQAQLSLVRTRENRGIALIVEDVLVDGALLAETVLETEIASMALRNHIVIPAPPIEQGTGMDITLVTRTTPVAWKEEGKTNPRYLAYWRAAPAMAWKDTRKQGQKGTSQQIKKTCPYPGLVKYWAMPTWCHMFNSALIGVARVWFDELPLESIDGYKGLKAAFLAYFMHQKKYVKNPVEIHNIKQRDRETIEEFIEHFKLKPDV